MGRLTADGGVDHQLDLAGADRVFDVRATLVHLQHGLHLEPRRREGAGGAFGGHQAEAHLIEALGDGQQG